MKCKILFVSIAAVIAACGDDSSSTTRPSDNELSSAVILSSSSVSLSEVEGSLTDIRDGQTYKTITIGSQTWMAQNLNYKTADSYCYDDKASNCSKYGRLYTWAAAMMACPSGWHLPSDDEFRFLFTTVGGRSTAGSMLKSTSGWYRNGNGKDDYLFSALPTGSGGGRSLYSGEGYEADFWSSSLRDRGNAYHMYLRYDDIAAYTGSVSKDFGFSVRCVKD